MRRRFRPNVSAVSKDDSNTSQTPTSNTTTAPSTDDSKVSQSASQGGNESASAKRRSRIKPSVSVRTRPLVTVPEPSDSSNSVSGKDATTTGQDGPRSVTGVVVTESGLATGVAGDAACGSNNDTSSGTLASVNNSDGRVVDGDSCTKEPVCNDALEVSALSTTSHSVAEMGEGDAAIPDGKASSTNTITTEVNDNSSENFVIPSQKGSDHPPSSGTLATSDTSATGTKDTAGSSTNRKGTQPTVPTSNTRRSRIKPKITQRPRSTGQGRTSTVPEKEDQSQVQTEVTSQSVVSQGEATPSTTSTELPRSTQPDSNTSNPPPSTATPVSHNTPTPTPPCQTTEHTPSEMQSTPTSSQGRRRRAVPNLNSLSRRRSHLTSISEDDTQQSEAENNKKQNETQPSNVQARSTDSCAAAAGRTVDMEDDEHSRKESTDSRKRRASESEGPTNEDSASTKKKETSNNAKRRSTAARLKVGKDGVDPTKMTMSDLIYYNPKSNPLRSSVEEKEKRKRQNERGEGSVVGSPTRSISGNLSPRTDTATTPVESPSITGGTDLTDSGPSTSDGMGGSSEGPSIAPQIKIAADGSIVLDEESLTIMQSPEAIRLDDSEVVYEDANTVPFNPVKKRTKSKMWQTEETLFFYKVLSQIGTDFSLMALMFPNRTRTELKRKFKKEEKRNRPLIDKALRAHVPLDEELFKKADAEETEETIAGLESNENEQSTSNVSTPQTN